MDIVQPKTDFKYFSCIIEPNAHKGHIIRGNFNSGSVICDECGKSLSSKRRLAEHIKTKHDKAKTYSCNDCDKQFKNAAGLKAHNEEFHKQKKGPEMCPECGKMVHFSSLKRHRLIHLTNIRCDMCGARNDIYLPS